VLRGGDALTHRWDAPRLGSSAGFFDYVLNFPNDEPLLLAPFGLAYSLLY